MRRPAGWWVPLFAALAACSSSSPGRETCSAGGACGGGTLQVCATQDSNGACTGIVYETSDGQSFRCATCADCAQAIESAANACGGGTATAGNGGTGGAGSPGASTDGGTGTVLDGGIASDGGSPAQSCRPCLTDTDCQGGAACVQIGQDTYCAPSCEAGASCPSGTQCAAVTSVGGEQVQSCVGPCGG